MADEHDDVRDERVRREDRDLAVDIFEGVRGHDGNPVMPVRLKAEDMFCFSCHKGVPCWNVCCHGADVTLTPWDILRLSNRLGVRPREFLAAYTVPAIWEKAGLPVAKLVMGGADGKGPCTFLAGEDGCSVYADRPATCRYYPLGMAAAKMKDADAKSEFHFLVKESHCKGHDEEKLQSVDAFRREQGIGADDDVNRGWIDILMKMVSWKSIGGPGGRDVTSQAKKMFYMVSTDVDAFRRFVFESRFLETYAVDPAVVESLKVDDRALLALGFDWMKNVLFNEPTIAMKEDVLRAAIARNRADMGGI